MSGLSVGAPVLGTPAVGQKHALTASGLSTGTVLFGCIGSSKRLDFTVMGDTVNLGARLEALTRQYPQHDLIISQATYERVADLVDVESLGEVTVKGKSQPVKVYGVLGLR